MPSQQPDLSRVTLAIELIRVDGESKKEMPYVRRLQVSADAILRFRGDKLEALEWRTFLYKKWRARLKELLQLAGLSVSVLKALDTVVYRRQNKIDLLTFTLQHRQGFVNCVGHARVDGVGGWAINGNFDNLIMNFHAYFIAHKATFIYCKCGQYMSKSRRIH